MWPYAHPTNGLSHVSPHVVAWKARSAHEGCCTDDDVDDDDDDDDDKDDLEDDKGADADEGSAVGARLCLPHGQVRRLASSAHGGHSPAWVKNQMGIKTRHETNVLRNTFLPHFLTKTDFCLENT